MEYTIEHEVPGRVRVRLAGRVPEGDVDALNRVLLGSGVISKATVYPRTGYRERVLAALAAVDAEAVDEARRDCSVALAPRTNNLLMDIATLLGGYFARRWFLPAPLSTIYTIWSYRGFLKAGLYSLLSGHLNVTVLDDSAIGI